MNVEQRLVDALRSVDRVEPSDDLWSRVVHSIEEDRAHRRRVVQSFVAVVVTVAALVGVGVSNVIDTPFGHQMRIPAIELIETVALVLLVTVLGPAIRRFGRGYAQDLWRATPETSTVLLRLLDVAYLLVFGGYILLTSSFEFGRSSMGIARQLEDVGGRVGGLLLTMGMLHAITIVALPVVALVSNSTRVGRALPRWLVVVLFLVAGAGALLAAWSTVGLVVAGIG